MLPDKDLEVIRQLITDAEAIPPSWTYPVIVSYLIEKDEAEFTECEGLPILNKVSVNELFERARKRLKKAEAKVASRSKRTSDAGA